MEDFVDSGTDEPRTPRDADGIDVVEHRSEGKYFNDPVHKHFCLKPVSCAIMDGKPFQRLRNLKQLGFAYYVYPGAAHNRFEHSLGVAHLSGKWADELMRKDRAPHEEIDRCSTLLELAGLCHDLGHGPFSHIWEKRILPRVGIMNWHHELMSEALVDYIVDSQAILEDYDLTRGDVEIVKKLIAGDKPKRRWIGGCDVPLYLYDVVNNRTNGIDVDKLDYLQRDSLHAGVPVSASYDRLVLFTKPGENCIQFRLHERENLWKIFHDRATLHRDVYTHKTARGIELMVADALQEVGRELKLAERSQHIEQFLSLSDTLLDYVQNFHPADTAAAQKAKHLLSRVERRELYKFCGQMRIPTKRISAFKDGIPAQEITTHQSVDLRPDDIHVDTVYIDKGMRNLDPLQHVQFYKERSVERCDFDDPSGTLQWLWLRAYCKQPEHVHAVKTAFHAYQKFLSMESQISTPNPSESKMMQDDGMSD